jgi:stage V sporulation protein R
VLDAAHALSLQCRRNLAIRKPSTEEVRSSALQAAEPPVDPFRSVHRRPEYVAPDLRRNPPEPDEDVLLFIRDNNSYLSEWERDLLTIAHEQAQYFFPQMETKIMNEGWASFWHKHILESLELEPELNLEFLVRHNQVIRPHEGGLNPYHVGIRIWEALHKRCQEEDGKLDPLFAVRESDRDASFLRRHLSEELIRDLDLFEYGPKGDELVITEVADEEGWESVRDTLIASVGSNMIPVIRVGDGDRGGKRGLLLVHEHDGRDLNPEYAEKTLGFAYQLWQNEITLETMLGGKRSHLVQNERGFSVRAAE